MVVIKVENVRNKVELGAYSLWLAANSKRIISFPSLLQRLRCLQFQEQHG